ncbi:hypothetical protein [Demequina aestuarii]|uniref:hypothetical protein n=1 Tax=Demequina aestuarii TaxID=327095 RepID=UPI000781404F|nr:hypothetical protein [Demequina aestuarii]
MIDTLDSAFAAALRRELVSAADATAARVPSRRFWPRRSGLIGGLTVVLVTGAGVATAVITGTPGGEIVTPLGEPKTMATHGPGTLDLGQAPDEATAIKYRLDCLTPGHFEIEGSGSVVCGEDDILAGTAWTGGQIPLDAVSDGMVEIRASVYDEWSLTASYIAAEPVPLAVNENGETYGTDAFDARPDLILAWATNGREGYIRRAELDAAHGPMPTSPAHALEMQATPPPRPDTIPVYESDGITVIGEFSVG